MNVTLTLSLTSDYQLNVDDIFTLVPTALKSINHNDAMVIYVGINYVFIHITLSIKFAF